MSDNVLNQHIESQAEELLYRSIKVQYPILGSIPKIDQVPYVDMNNQIEVTKNSEQEDTKQRQDFLISFYLKLLIRTLTIIIILLLSYMKWFRAIVLKEYRIYSYQSGSLQDFIKGQLDDKYYRQQYEEGNIQRKLNQYNLILHQTWTFQIFFVTLIALLLLTFAKKKTQFIKSTQKINFYLQNVLISFIVVGIIGEDNLNSDYGHIMWTAISSLIIIMSFLMLQLVNVKLHFWRFTPKEIILTTLIISFILNIIRALSYDSIPLSFMLIQIFISYPIYYFQQLNQSILELTYKESECKFNLKQSLTNFISYIKIDNKDQEIMKLVQNNHIVIKKMRFKFTLSIVILVGQILFCISIITLVGLNLFCIFEELFIILLGLQLIGLLFETQIISNNKNRVPDYNDTDLSVCLMLIDILFPIKNIWRSIQRIKRQ